MNHVKCFVVLMYTLEVQNVYQCSILLSFILVRVMFFKEHLGLAHEIDLVQYMLMKIQIANIRPINDLGIICSELTGAVRAFWVFLNSNKKKSYPTKVCCVGLIL